MNSRYLTRPHLLNRYFFTVLLICVTYAALAIFLVPHWVLSADEFVFARHIYDYTRFIPYRDFEPYKSILGYYLLSVPFYFSHTLLDPLFYMKKEVILINAASIAAICWLTQGLFNRRAILFAILAVMANSTFFIYAADLRVDMLTSWFCLFSLITLLKQRTAWAGTLMGIAFLISQKALWYLFAANGALLLCYFLFQANLFSFRSILRFNLTAAIPVILYILIWSSISSFSIVLHNLFYEAYIQASIEWYTPIYFTCWLIVLQHGPALFLLWPLTFTTLTNEHAHTPAIQQRTFIILQASIFLLLFIHYKQAFPYNFVFTVPAFFLLSAEFISWLLSPKARQYHRIIMLYSILLFLFINLLSLPMIYNLLVLLPFLISRPMLNWLTYGILIACAILYPFYTSFRQSIHIDGEYQQSILAVADALLDAQSTYVGGLPYIYNKEQPINGLKNIIGPELDYLYQPKKSLKPLLLSSLYLSAVTQEDVIYQLDKAPVKVIINNYRVHYLPASIARYLDYHYAPYLGSLYLYAPVVTKTQHHFAIKFSDNYRIQSQSFVYIDGKKLKNHSFLYLTKGMHQTASKTDYRLILIPKTQLTHHAYPQDEWLKMLRAILS